MDKIQHNQSFGGAQQRFRHFSKSLDCDMTFGVYLPPAALAGSDTRDLPLVWWLSGITCTDENFVQKAGAQRIASELGLIIVAPDTSPRGEKVPVAPNGEFYIGQGAGFYVNATEEPWRHHYRMYDYIAEELPALVAENFPVDISRQSIMGHSMGGHGALSIALSNPDRFRSVSVFAAMVSPLNSPWAGVTLELYLGSDRESWRQYDSCSLIREAEQQIPLLVDQGAEDEFLEEQLKPHLLLEAAAEVDYPLEYKLREGYDHSYFYVASFIEQHLRFHAEYLA